MWNFAKGIICLIVGTALSVANAVLATSGDPAGPDSAATAAQTVIAPRLTASTFDTVQAVQYGRARSVTFGHFLERSAGYVVERRGPLGSEAAFSRWGFGRGRGQLFLGSVPLNDPQDGRAPLAVVPESAVGRLAVEGAIGAGRGVGEGIEGAVQILEPSPVVTGPSATFDVSTGNRGLEQRRVRFGSAAGSMGIDLSYDELRNDGYYFDASGSIVDVPRLGNAVIRGQGLNVRGKLAGGQRYRFAFRRFTSNFRGDARGGSLERRRSGQYGVLHAAWHRAEVVAFSKGFKTELEDDFGRALVRFRNETAGGHAHVTVARSASLEIVAGVQYEDVLARQNLDGVKARTRRQEAAGSLVGSLRVDPATTMTAAASGARRLAFSTAWGARVGIARELGGSVTLGLDAHRRYRMPTIEEQFLPRHVDADGVTREGNRDLDPETSLEGSARVAFRWGGLLNEVRGTYVRMSDPITWTAGVTPASPVNGTEQAMTVIDNRLRCGWSLWGLDAAIEGSVEAALGDKVRFFEGVPALRSHASLGFGRAMFRGTSAFELTGTYQFTDERRVDGRVLDPYTLVDVRFDFRLLDADIYVSWLNVLDEQYQTVSPYLMTPRTLVYGVMWTLYD